MKWYQQFQRPCSPATFIERLRKLLDEGLGEIEFDTCDLFGMRRFPRYNDRSIIEQVIQRSTQEEQRRLRQRNYYRASAACFRRAINLVAPEQLPEILEGINDPRFQEQACHDYRDLIRTLLVHFDILMDDYREFVQGGDRHHHLNPSKHTYEIYQAAVQQAYGIHTMQVFTDRNPDISPLYIRQLIELRLRRAIGVRGATNTATGDHRPIQFSSILEVFRRHERHVRLPEGVELAHIDRIYRWASVFVHVGQREYIWKPLFVLYFLGPLFRGVRLGRGRMDVHSGIRMTEATIRAIRQDLITAYRRERGGHHNLLMLPRSFLEVMVVQSLPRRR